MSMVDKFWRLLGVGEEVEEEIIELPLPIDKKADRRNNLVSLHTAKSVKVIVCEPTTFEEAQAVADHLKNRRQVILNLDHTPGDVSQRMLDFVSGTTYALDGNMQKLGEGIFLFVPSNVEISKDSRLLMRSYSFGRRNAFQE